MASNERAIVNNLNDRAKFFGGDDAPQLTIYDLRALLSYYNRTCLKCGKKPATSADHVKSLKQGGSNSLDNLQLLCVNCNKAKGTKDTDYRKGRICPANAAPTVLAEKTSRKTDRELRPSFHGKKGRSGRKPAEATMLKRRLVQDKVEEAEASFAFLVDVRDNPEEPTAQRVASAIEILDRVIGKPVPIQTGAGEELYKTYVKRLKEFVSDGKPMGEDPTGQGVQLGGSWIHPAPATNPDTPVA